MGKAHGKEAPDPRGRDMKALRQACGYAVFAISVGAVPVQAQTFDPGKAAFSLAYKEEKSPYRISPAFLMPGEVLEIAVPSSDAEKSVFALDAVGYEVKAIGRAAWAVTAPHGPGLHPLIVRRQPGGDSSVLNAFVMVPSSEMRGEYLNGYRIGAYPAKTLKGLTFYKPPAGFILADARTSEAAVSPHFTLDQFLCKQSRSLPAYLLLRERLVLKLEAVLELVNAHGYACSTFHVMSGYRTPYYNRAIGNVKFSAHQWGGASDIFVDQNPKDGNMDDLNGDGEADLKDSKILFDIVEKLALDKYYLPYLGGIGTYNKNESHGPFVHVDVRGFRAVW